MPASQKLDRSPNRAEFCDFLFTPFPVDPQEANRTLTAKQHDLGTKAVVFCYSVKPPPGSLPRDNEDFLDGKAAIALWSPRVLVAVGFLMLLLTSLQGWGMVGIIAFTERPALSDDFRRLHNLGLSGGFLAISFGLTLIVLSQPERRVKVICKILLPSLLLAPVAFSDRSLAILLGKIPSLIQAFFFGLQAVSALGISVSLAMMVVFLVKKTPIDP